MQINGAVVAAMRERSGLTQTALSERTSPRISQGRISEIEAAGVIAVRPATGIALADALGVSIVVIEVPAVSGSAA